ncbi:MAG: YHYH protein [Bacteroidia bacterium]|nr:YHYH protein [Bacteroidia bacterium]
MKKTLLLSLLPFALFAQTPEITSWLINPGGQTGYAGIPSNVQLVQYSANQVYVTTTCIPDYSIGPWTANPNTPVNQNFLFKITRTPVQNAGNPVNTPLGHIGVWTNGVSIFNAKDGMSYNNQGVWNRDAYVFEGISFDNCLGHPAPNGEYHLHVNPTCLYDDTDSTVHAPIIGYAFDGFPIYGSFGFSNVNGTGPTRKMQTSYRLRTITSRTTLPNGTVLNASQYGPAIGGTYPLGAFLEDYEYVPGLGDLDEHNGRYCITPEYPSGIYAYFVSIGDNEVPLYPYVLGPTYYGLVQPGNTGPGSGHNTISETVVTYVPGTTVVQLYNDETPLLTISSQSGEVVFVAGSGIAHDAIVTFTDISGRVIKQYNNIQADVENILPVGALSHGIYILSLYSGNTLISKKLVH